MKIQFHFDKAQRSLEMVPEDELERLFLNQISTQCEKGVSLNLRRIPDQHHDEDSTFLVELKVNGK
jgi:hypothetical protein